ncbi:MAG TPA: thioredoxin domain-containing protein [Arachnia sp.]|nr:thioredoxin domain-containing protein [Arachnia sp.]HMT86184.1 thioredoxin domain-containing protein [Arachnia sp.]
MNAAPHPNARRRAVVPVAVIGVSLVLIVLVTLQQWGSSTSAAPQAPQGSGAPTAVATAAPSGAQTPREDLTVYERRDAGDPLSAGSVDAPVALVVFSDYQCGYCAKWSADTLPTLLAYAERGDLWIEWRDLNIFGAPSERASRASYAAGLQSAFWEFHDQLFPGGATRSEAELSDDALVALAVGLGLDADRFASDMSSAETVAAVEANAQLGYSLGASSTPSFLLGGTPIVGAQPTEVFVEAIDAALAAQG